MTLYSYLFNLILLGLHFGATLEHFRGTLVPLWGDFGHMELSLGDCGPLLAHFWGTLVSLWVYSGIILLYEGSLATPGAAFGSIWEHCEVTLGLLHDGGFGPLWARFGVTLSSVWVHF